MTPRPVGPARDDCTIEAMNHFKRWRWALQTRHRENLKMIVTCSQVIVCSLYMSNSQTEWTFIIKVTSTEAHISKKKKNRHDLRKYLLLSRFRIFRGFIVIFSSLIESRMRMEDRIVWLFCRGFCWQTKWWFFAAWNRFKINFNLLSADCSSSVVGGGKCSFDYFSVCFFSSFLYFSYFGFISAQLSSSQRKKMKERKYNFLELPPHVFDRDQNPLLLCFVRSLFSIHYDSALSPHTQLAFFVMKIFLISSTWRLTS